MHVLDVYRSPYKTTFFSQVLRHMHLEHMEYVLYCICCLFLFFFCSWVNDGDIAYNLTLEI